jgi:hypothetical protein
VAARLTLLCSSVPFFAGFVASAGVFARGGLNLWNITALFDKDEATATLNCH